MPQVQKTLVLHWKLRHLRSILWIKMDGVAPRNAK